MEKATFEVHLAIQDRERDRLFESHDEMNAFLREKMDSGEPMVASDMEKTPVERAQTLMYKAWDARGKKRRVQLARLALDMSPDCADAYVLLAEETTDDPVEGRALYEEGVLAGERALGAETFEEEEGAFWLYVPTRPYMRARFGLAQSLWALGELQEAIEHLREMLCLNPNDNQGVRYLFAVCLLSEDMDEELGELLEQYEDDPAPDWLYTRALWKFRASGVCQESKAYLAEAIEENPLVLGYLFGRWDIPEKIPATLGADPDDDAANYVVTSGHLWHKTEGAFEWLAEEILERGQRVRASDIGP
jgi:tetratricopeptide (TPR) repeat protein